ncbi:MULTISPECIES: IclR family transcriptional regulator [Roseobacteraceae]|uniref:IclR family transcriptional regulator n=1 Tax=Roseobacteraceae TaxID=2854170 RepID=UPI00080AC2C6|nr:MULTISPECIES: IclR family transcriptional regulator [Roseobacteraceae]ANT62279.1 hypothetical protein AYJ57_17810 [Salipiger sp. CCB-MM3]
MSDATEKEGRGVRAVETGLSLLGLFLDSDGPLSAADLALRSGLSKAQVHAYLVSLQRGNMVVRDPQTGRYAIGPFSLELGMSRLLTLDPQITASEEALKVARKLGQSISIAVWGRYGPVVTAVVQANDQLLNSAQPGTVYSVTGTATGRLFAALTNEAEAREIAKLQMAEVTPPRYVGACPPFDEIHEPLETVRRTGVSITYSFPQPGVTAISAPVYNFSDELELAVTMIGPAEEIDISLEGNHVAPLRALAATISRKLGFIGKASGA